MWPRFKQLLLGDQSSERRSRLQSWEPVPSWLKDADTVETIRAEVDGIIHGGAAVRRGDGDAGQRLPVCAEAGHRIVLHFKTTPGRYKVFCTWVKHTNRATNVRYVLPRGAVTVDQQQDPGGWHLLGEAEAGETLAVVLDATGVNGPVIADAVMIERLAGPPPAVKVAGEIRTRPDGSRELVVPLP